MTAVFLRARFVDVLLVQIMVLFGAGVAPAQPAPSSGLAFRQALAEELAASPALAAFYRERDYAPLWTSSGDATRRAALFGALDMAPGHGLPAERYDAAGLKEAFRGLTSERQRGRLEARVTRAFIVYAEDMQSGLVDPASVDRGIVREVSRRDRLATLRSFAAADPAAFIAALPPAMPQYEQLRRAKLDLERLIARGGWGGTVRAGTLRPGDTGAPVIALRDRLVRMGYLARSARAGYDREMQRAVQRFQIDHGLRADGIAGKGTLAEINLGAERRLQSVVVAMERLRWMNNVPLGRRHVWVNLPDFSARIVDDGKVTFETDTIVGMNEPDRRSPEFSDMMEYMVINPTWYVPRSIAVKEYLPLLRKNPNAVGHLKIVDRRGRVVDRSRTDFRQFTAKTFPFTMSQPPSDRNALGFVKFMFPNRWNIYLHDTPTKALFEEEVRAFSHGCVRLREPFEFAYALLSRQTEDPEGEFRRVLRTGRETTVALKQPVPVHLVYFTAWPDARGKIEFRRDVYGRDQRIFDALRSAGVVLDALQG